MNNGSRNLITEDVTEFLAEAVPNNFPHINEQMKLTINSAGFEILMVVSMEISVCWGIMLCSTAKVNR
jgi:hypothetical protein